MMKIRKKCEQVRFKNYGSKLILSYMIHVDFESILVPEDNGNQN